MSVIDAATYNMFCLDGKRLPLQCKETKSWDNLILGLEYHKIQVEKINPCPAE